MVDKTEIRKMRDSGMTLREIAKEKGVSYQRVGEICGGMYARYSRGARSPGKIIFKGLREWMTVNKVNRAKFCDLLGYESSTTTQSRINAKLYGRTEFKMKEIKKILEVTGMTFEEAFEEDFVKAEKYQLYTEYRGGKPVAYRYGEPWVAEQLLVEGGYSTPEEAKAVWFEYLEKREGQK